jgi:hypothetical protein
MAGNWWWFRSNTLSFMAGPDPAIHANTGLVAFAWMLGSSPSMTVVVPEHESNRQHM